MAYDYINKGIILSVYQKNVVNLFIIKMVLKKNNGGSVQYYFGYLYMCIQVYVFLYRFINKVFARMS